MYKVIRSFLFLFDPEWVHYFSMNGLKFLCKIPGIKKLISGQFVPPAEKNIPVRPGHPGGHKHYKPQTYNVAGT